MSDSTHEPIPIVESEGYDIRVGISLPGKPDQIPPIVVACSDIGCRKHNRGKFVVVIDETDLD